MKHLFFLTIFLFVAAIVGNAQLFQVPDLVKQTFEKQFPDAKDAKWSGGIDNHSVQFSLGDKKLKANYTPKADWVSTEEKVVIDSLPSTIQDNFKNLDDENRDSVIAKTKNELFEVLKQTIRPEFLNRIDESILFLPLTKKEVSQIVALQLEELKIKLRESDLNLVVTPEAFEHILTLGYDPFFGARPVKRVIQKQVLNELSKANRQVIGCTFIAITGIPRVSGRATISIAGTTGHDDIAAARDRPI